MKTNAALVLPLALVHLACAGAAPAARGSADPLTEAPRRAATDPIVVGVFELEGLDGIAPSDRAALHDAFVAGLGAGEGIVVETLRAEEADGAVPAGVEEAAVALAQRTSGDLPDVFVWPHATREAGAIAVRTEVLSAYGTGRATHRAKGAPGGGSEVARDAAGTVGTFIAGRLGPGLPSREAVRRVRAAEGAALARDAMPLDGSRIGVINRICSTQVDNQL